MSKIVFVGGEFRNKGCEAMIISTAVTLKRFEPSINFSVISKHSEDTSKDLGMGFEILWDNTRNIPLRLYLLFTAFLYRISPAGAHKLLTRSNPILREFSRADAVIDISGFALTDDIGLKRMLVFFSGTFLCKLLGIPIVVYPQSIGPFYSPWSRIMVKLFLPMADLVMVRGKQSKKALEQLGINTSEMHTCADSAFLFEATSSETGTELLESYGWIAEKGLVGVVPSVRIYDRYKIKGNAKTYVMLLANMIDFIVKEFDVQVVLMPFEFMPDEHDDQFVARAVLEKVKRKESVFTLDREPTAAELKAIVGQCKFLLTSRFHSIVFALSLGVPVFAIGWSFKYVELMSRFGLEEYVIDYAGVHSNIIERKMKKMWLKKEEVGKIIENEAKNIEPSALKAAKIVVNLLSRNKRTKTNNP